MSNEGEQSDADRPTDLTNYSVRIVGGEHHEKFGAALAGSAGKWIVLLRDSEAYATAPQAWYRLDAKEIALVFQTWEAYGEWFDRNDPRAVSLVCDVCGDKTFSHRRERCDPCRRFGSLSGDPLRTASEDREIRETEARLAAKGIDTGWEIVPRAKPGEVVMIAGIGITARGDT